MNKVHLIDCMEFMRALPDKHYSLAIVDPPYGINASTMNLGIRKLRPDHKEWDSSPPDESYFNELFRVSENQIIWGANYFKLPPTRGIIAWTKTIEMQNRAFSEWEMAWTSFDMVARWIDLKPFLRDGLRIHPTQKPVALYKWLLENYAKPNDKIFDSHVGSGSIRIACHDMGFDFEGCEIDPDYWQMQEKRFEIHAKRPRLFESASCKISPKAVPLFGRDNKKEAR